MVFERVRIVKINIPLSEVSNWNTVYMAERCEVKSLAFVRP